MWRASPLLLLLAPWGGLAQESRGQAEIAAQGFYLGGSREPSITSTGYVADLQYYFERSGRLAARFETYWDPSSTYSGENFVSFFGAPWLGMRWNLDGGDYRLALRPEGTGPVNLYMPDLRLRGGRVEMVGGAFSVSVFAGRLMVLQGPRMPYYFQTPQASAGAAVRWKRDDRIAVQSMLLFTTTDTARFDERGYLLPVGRRFENSAQWITNASWNPVRGLRIFGEGALHSASRVPAQNTSSLSLFSGIASAEWEGGRWQARGNYVRQGAAYMPMTGYFLGDRKGPYGEFNYKLTQRVSAFVSGHLFETNVDRRPLEPTLRAVSSSGGLTAELPGKIYAMGNLSYIGFRSRANSAASPENSRNRLAMASALRGFRQFSVRAGWRQMDLWQSSGGKTSVRSLEGDGTLTRHRFSLGGGIRLDTTLGAERRNSLFYRGSAQAYFNRFSAYASAEIGRDLFNESIFMANQVRTTVAGVSMRLAGGWSLSSDLMRFGLNTSTNPESAFLLANQGLPVQVLLADSNRWSLFFRLAKTLRWGAPLPRDPNAQALSQLYPVMGSLEGLVQDPTGGASPVAGIAVTLDDGRKETTDATGRYRFIDVPEGRHTVALELRELPAEYEPGPVSMMDVLVAPRRSSRADFQLTPLLSLPGKLTAADGIDLGDIVIRLSPGGRYTTPDADGTFCFYNVKPGRYRVTVDAASLPRDTRLTGAPSLDIDLASGQELPAVLFGIARVEQEKRVREIQLNGR